MAYEKIDLETPQPNGKVGEPGPTAWAKARRMFVELYDSWTPASRSLAKVTPAADKLPYFTGQEAAALADLSSFARSLLDDQNASVALSTLGVSDFVKTLLDDASASAFLDTLGGTSLGKSLLTTANQASARNSLGLGPAALVAVLGAVTTADSSAIMEKGTGTYGTFYRFKNGLQVCLSSQLGSNPITNAFGPLYRSTSVPWVFPAQFGGDVAPLTYAQDQSETIWCGCSQGSFTSANITSIYPASIGGNRPLFAFAIGKWANV